MPQTVFVSDQNAAFEKKFPARCLQVKNLSLVAVFDHFAKSNFCKDMIKHKIWKQATRRLLKAGKFTAQGRCRIRYHFPLIHLLLSSSSHYPGRNFNGRYRQKSRQLYCLFAQLLRINTRSLALFRHWFIIDKKGRRLSSFSNALVTTRWTPETILPAEFSGHIQLN